MSKNETTKQKTKVPQGAAAKTDKSSAKKSPADANDAEIQNVVEDTAAVEPETFAGSEPLTETETAPGTIWGVAKGTPNVAAMKRDWAIVDLQEKHGEQIVEAFLNGTGKPLLPSAERIYSLDRAKLAAYVKKQGWGDADALPGDPVSPGVAPAAKLDDGEVIEGEGGIKTIPDIEETSEESNFIPDPEILAQLETNVFSEILETNGMTDDFMQEFLTQKEQDLIKAVSKNKKFLAGIAGADAKLWTSIKEKFESFKRGDQAPLDNFRKGDALAKHNDVIEAEVMNIPLDDAERELLENVKKSIFAAKEAFETSPRVMMEGFTVIRNGRLYRETHMTLEDFAKDVFGISRSYASNLALFGQIIPHLGNDSLFKSVRSLEAMAVETNKIADQIGVDKSDFEAMAPIVKAVAQIVADVSTGDDGKVNVTGRTIQAVHDVVTDVVKSGTVEIEGKQMKVEEAKAKGVLGLAVNSQIIHTVAENIMSQRQSIIDSVKAANVERTAPHSPQNPPALEPKKDEKFFKGKTPEYDTACTYHTEKKRKNVVNRVIAVFNAGFQLACGCKFQRLTTSGEEFVCIEADGLPIKQD